MEILILIWLGLLTYVVYWLYRRSEIDSDYLDMLNERFQEMEEEVGETQCEMDCKIDQIKYEIEKIVITKIEEEEKKNRKKNKREEKKRKKK